MMNGSLPRLARARRAITAAITVLAGVSVAAAQTAERPAQPGAAGDGRRALQAVRAPQPPPVIDGRLQDAVWATAAWTGGFVQRHPTPGAEASERTEVAVLYDADALYVGARMYAHRDSIVGQLARRDAPVFSDWFYVAIDGDRDRRTGASFGVNPRGVKRDVLLYDDVLEDDGWDAVWDVAVQIDSLGWTAEFRIPLSQIRFGRGGADVATAWGVNFRRHIALRNETADWAPIPRDAAGYVSLFGELRGLHDLARPRRLELQPYSALGLTRAPGAAPDPFHRANALSGRLGADVKYGLSSSFTLTATVNPDFGQVDADPSVVNLTAYETFFPERRPFFVEGADVFHAGGPQLFYSRRIGRAPQGRLPPNAVFVDAPAATTILGAAKLSGKTGTGWSAGVLSAVTAREDAPFAADDGRRGAIVLEPLTHYGVARVTRDFAAGRGTLGGILTAANRSLDEATDHLRSAAYAGGVDGRVRPGSGDHEIRGYLLGSAIFGSEASIAEAQRAAGRYFHRPDAAHVSFDPARTSLGGFASGLSVQRIQGGHWRWGLGGSATTPGFEVNDLGFHPRVDAIHQNASVAYVQFEPGRHLQHWRVELAEVSGWTFGGERFSTALQAEFDFGLPDNSGGFAGLTRQLATLLPDALRGGPALRRPAGWYGWAGAYSDHRRPLRVQLVADGSVEDETGGHGFSLHPSLRLRPSGRSDVSIGLGFARTVNPWQYVESVPGMHRTHFVHGRLEQTVASLTARVNHTFTPSLSLQAYAQPFIAAGDFSRYLEVLDPRAARHATRFFAYPDGRVSAAGGELHVDVDGDGAPDLSFSDPAFNVAELRTNVVVRWEYRPGSALFVAWSQGRDTYAPDGAFSLDGDARRLWRAPATNVLLVKFSYWWGL